MKTEHLKNIPSKEGFTKKWWQGKRSLRAKGSGVGKALVAWNAAGMPPGGRVAKLKSAKHFEAAFAACNALEKALETAMGKVRAKALDTVAGIKVYQEELMKHFQALLKEYERRVDKYKSDREELLKYCADGHKRMEIFATEAKKINSDADKLEKAINDAIGKGHVAEKKASLSSKADELFNLADKNLDAAQKWSDAYGNRVSKERDAKFGASAYGVMAEQKSKLDYLFDKATVHTEKSAMWMGEVKSVTEETKEAIKEIRELLKAGSQSIERSAARAKATADGASKTFKAIEKAIKTCDYTFQFLGQLAKGGGSSARSGTVENAKKFLQVWGDGYQQVNMLVKKLETSVTKCTQRIPKGQRTDPTVSTHFDTYVKSLRQAISSRKQFDKKITVAKGVISKILSAK